MRDYSVSFAPSHTGGSNGSATMFTMLLLPGKFNVGKKTSLGKEVTTVGVRVFKV